MHVSTMEDGPIQNATLSIQEPATEMHPVYESGWYRIQEQFQEIQVSIQVTIDRWPGNSLCPGQVTRKLKMTQKDTCRVMWPGNSMCPLKRTPSAVKVTPSADRQKDTCNTVPSRNSEYKPLEMGVQGPVPFPPLIVTNLYLSSLPRLLSHLGFRLLYPLITV